MRFWRRKIRLADLLLVPISLAYPFLVYFGLMRFSPLAVGVALIAFLLIRILLQRGRLGGRSELWLGLFVLGALLLLFLLDTLLAIKAYPVLISLSFAGLFGYSLIAPPPIIERVARMMEGELDDFARRYTRHVTEAWVIFFLLNAAISLWTALYASIEVWTLYNGFISYLLIGAMFGGEYLLRRHFKRRNAA